MKRKFSIFEVILYILLSVFALSVLYPFYYMIILSVSSYGGILSADQGLMFKPQGFTLAAYTELFQQSHIQSGYKITIFRSVFGTLCSMFFMSMAAYSLSKKTMPFNGFITGIFIFTMFFSGGMIPQYLLVKSINLLDKPILYILLPLYNTFHIMVLRNFFMAIPNSLDESAKIDGANDVTVLFKIILPLSKPALYTVGLWNFVSHWNSWFDSMLYMSTPKYQTLQDHVRSLIILKSESLTAIATSPGEKMMMPTGQTLGAAAVLITVIPILIMFPFIRKHFQSGIMIGSVKG